MKKSLMIVLVAAAALAMAVPAFAFNQGTIRIGTGNEFSSTSISLDGGGDIDTDALALEGGYFVIDNLEVGISYSNVDTDGVTVSENQLYGKYFFPFQANSFFAGGGFGTMEFDTADGDYMFIKGGFAWQLKTYFSIDFALMLGQGDIEGTDIDITDISATYSLYF